MYAYLAVKRRYKISSPLTFTKIRQIAEIRREYIPMYMAFLRVTHSVYQCHG